MPALYSKHREAILTPLSARFGNQFQTTLEGVMVFERNPLMNFVWNSADLLADEALGQLTKRPGRNSNNSPIALPDWVWEKLEEQHEEKALTARKIRDAQFMHEMPPGLPDRVTPTAELKDEYERVIDQLVAIERSYEHVLGDPERRIDLTEFNRGFRNFALCYTGELSSSDQCKKMNEYLVQIHANPASQEDRDYNEAKDAFGVGLGKHNFRKIFEGYEAGTVKFGEVFSGLNANWTAYGDLERNLRALSFEQAEQDGQADADIQAGIDFMTESFENAYDSIRNQVFEGLRNEATRVKLARMRQAANMLAQDPAALPEGEAARLLWEMASKLNCLTQYAVGPAFDQQAPGPAPVLEELPRVILPPPPAPAAL